MSYFNSEQEAYMESLARMPLSARCFCGWDRAGKCDICNRRYPDLTCADKCLECSGIGNRWQMIGRDRRWRICPDCSGTGRTKPRKDGHVPLRAKCAKHDTANGQT